MQKRATPTQTSSTKPDAVPALKGGSQGTDGARGLLGPWLVAIGAALWGTESLWRIPLNKLFASEVIVFHEHVIQLLFLLPLLLSRRFELPKVQKRPWMFLLFSAIAGSVVGTILFTESLRRGNPTVVNVVLNIQPVLSTTFACVLLGDRLSKRFFVWAPVAVLAGMLLSVEHLDRFGAEFAKDGFRSGTGLALLCAFFWGLSTVAGRGAMMGMSLQLAAAMRVLIGTLCLTLLLLVRGKMNGADLWPAAAAAQPVTVVLLFLGLSVLSGGIPLLFYFEGLRRTRASTAGYFEMMQTLAAVVVTWGYFGHALAAHQVAAATLLVVAVGLVQHAQGQLELADVAKAPIGGS